MMSQASSIREKIIEGLAKVAPLEPEDIDELLEVPPDPEMGDYALPCFTLASEMRKSPVDIAAELAEGFEVPENVSEVRGAGPYLNFSVDRGAMARQVLDSIRESRGAYGGSDIGNGKTVVIDYSSPNIAKHLGVHHLRSAIIGRALYRIFGALGYDCVGINHLGDWGTSFGKLIVACERYPELDPDTATVSDLQEAYVRFSREARDNPDLGDEAREAFRRLEEGDPEARRLWKRFKKVSLAEFERIYDMLGIEFDHYTPESFYLDRTQELLERLQQHGIAEESEGALVVDLEEHDLPPMMLRKQDETTLYATRDLCAAEYRREEYDFEWCFYVVGGEQKLHFDQLKTVLELMGHDWADHIEHVDFGLLKFIDEETGQARKGSTRSGQMILLEDVLENGIQKAREKIRDNVDKLEAGADLDELAAQVGIGAVVFSDLCVNRSRDVIFDWDRMLDFEGDTGPYVQYAHARLCSILRKAGEDVDPGADCDRLELPEEWELIRKLEAYPGRVKAAARRRQPSVIANYLLELCSEFSSYYSAGMREPDRRVLCPDAQTRAARLLLVDAVRHVIHDGLQLLGVAAPERM